MRSLVLVLLASTLLACPGADELGPMQSDCQATHQKVGWAAQLSTLFHEVAGRAEIIDDCTISIPDFTYDGSGADVRFYVAEDDDFGAGRAISDDILGEVYEGEPITLPLPADITLDDFNQLSVWCVAFNADFGSGEFEAP